MILKNAQNYDTDKNQYPNVLETVSGATTANIGSKNNPSSNSRNSNTFVDNTVEQAGGQIKDFEGAVFQNSIENAEKSYEQINKSINVPQENIDREIREYQGVKDN